MIDPIPIGCYHVIHGVTGVDMIVYYRRQIRHTCRWETITVKGTTGTDIIQGGHRPHSWRARDHGERGWIY